MKIICFFPKRKTDSFCRKYLIKSLLIFTHRTVIPCSLVSYLYSVSLFGTGTLTKNTNERKRMKE